MSLTGQNRPPPSPSLISPTPRPLTLATSCLSFALDPFCPRTHARRLCLRESRVLLGLSLGGCSWRGRRLASTSPPRAACTYGWTTIHVRRKTLNSGGVCIYRVLCVCRGSDGMVQQGLELAAFPEFVQQDSCCPYERMTLKSTLVLCKQEVEAFFRLLYR